MVHVPVTVGMAEAVLLSCCGGPFLTHPDVSENTVVLSLILKVTANLNTKVFTLNITLARTYPHPHPEPMLCQPTLKLGWHTLLNFQRWEKSHRGLFSSFRNVKTLVEADPTAPPCSSKREPRH